MERVTNKEGGKNVGRSKSSHESQGVLVAVREAEIDVSVASVEAIYSSRAMPMTQPCRCIISAFTEPKGVYFSSPTTRTCTKRSCTLFIHCPEQTWSFSPSLATGRRNRLCDTICRQGQRRIARHVFASHPRNLPPLLIRIFPRPFEGASRIEMYPFCLLSLCLFGCSFRMSEVPKGEHKYGSFRLICGSP